MSFISETISDIVPETWTTETYETESYVTVPVSTTSEEYRMVKNLFQCHADSNKKVQNVYRVQDPYAYLRFLALIEQMENRNGTLQWERKLVCIKKSMLMQALYFNLDERRTPSRSLSVYEPDYNNEYILVKREIASCSTMRDSRFYIEFYFDVSS